MAKRFRSTDLWQEDWFIDMPMAYKLLWDYMLSSCDHAGIFKVNLRMFAAAADPEVNIKITCDEALSYFNRDKVRVRALSDRIWYVEDFFYFQYGETLNINNKVHKSALEIYDKQGISIDSLRGVTKTNAPIRGTIVKHSEKQLDPKLDPCDDLNLEPAHRVKDKDKDKGTVSRFKGGRGDTIGVIEETVIQNTREKKNESVQPPTPEPTEPIVLDENPTHPSDPPKFTAQPNAGRKIDFVPPSEEEKFRTPTLDNSPTDHAPRPKQRNGDLRYPWDSSEFRDLWEVWKDYQWDWAKRHSKYYPYRGPHAEPAALMELASMAQGREDLAKRILQATMGSDYKNFILPKSENDGRSKSNHKGPAGTNGTGMYNADYAADLARRLAESAAQSTHPGDTGR